MTWATSWDDIKNTVEPDVLPTLHYFFYMLRCGIYVRIRHGVIHTFLQFFNPQFTNTWGHKLRFEVGNNAREYHTLVDPNGLYLPVQQWWANAGILCNQAYYQNKWSGDRDDVYYNLISTTCKNVQHARFMLNVRDAPLARKDGLHPQLFLFSRGEAPTACIHLPVLSGYTGPDYLDIPIPLPRELNRAACTAVTPWSERQPRAVFRGSATGAGVTPSTNDRLALEQVARAHPDLFNVKFTGSNFRDKLLAPGDCVRRSRQVSDASQHHFLTPQQQSTFKYAVYIDGHSASSRWWDLIDARVCILRVASRPEVAGCDLWFYPYLIPWVHYVPIPSVNHLVPMILWLQEHDNVASRIANSTPIRFNSEKEMQKALQKIEIV